MNGYLDPSTWWDPYGTCRCGKPATGAVMGDRNQIMERTCKKCGEARILAAEKARTKARGSCEHHWVWMDPNNACLKCGATDGERTTGD